MERQGGSMARNETPERCNERILIIDDDDLVRATVRDILEEAGFAVLDAPDGRQGLEVFERNPVDAVITDILMPEKEGIETILEMRRIRVDVPIIAISGGGATGDLQFLQFAGRLGADRILPKPIDPAQLVQAVRQVLQAGSARRTVASGAAER